MFWQQQQFQLTTSSATFLLWLSEPAQGAKGPLSDADGQRHQQPGGLEAAQVHTRVGALPHWQPCHLPTWLQTEVGMADL